MINIASIFGVVGAPGYAAYCTSKAGLIALTKVAALELAGDNIRVNVIVPGGVSTPMNEHEKEGGVIPDTPLRRRARPSEISGAVVFLASRGLEFRHRLRAGRGRRLPRAVTRVSATPASPAGRCRRHPCRRPRRSRPGCGDGSRARPPRGRSGRTWPSSS